MTVPCPVSRDGIRVAAEPVPRVVRRAFDEGELHDPIVGTARRAQARPSRLPGCGRRVGRGCRWRCVSCACRGGVEDAEARDHVDTRVGRERGSRLRVERGLQVVAGRARRRFDDHDAQARVAMVEGELDRYTVRLPMGRAEIPVDAGVHQRALREPASVGVQPANLLGRPGHAGILAGHPVHREIRARVDRHRNRAVGGEAQVLQAPSARSSAGPRTSRGRPCTRHRSGHARTTGCARSRSRGAGRPS